MLLAMSGGSLSQYYYSPLVAFLVDFKHFEVRITDFQAILILILKAFFLQSQLCNLT